MRHWPVHLGLLALRSVGLAMGYLALSCLALGCLTGIPKAMAQPPAAAMSPCWAELFHEHGPQWAAPTRHAPLDLAQLLSGAGCVLIARPADLWAHPEGEKLRSAEPLASWVRAIDGHVQALAGVHLAEVEQVIVGLANDPQQGYHTSLVVRLKTPVDPAALRKHWGQPVEWAHEGQTFLATRDRLMFIPPGSGGKQFGMALGVTDRTAIFRELAGTNRGLWRRELEALLTTADGNRHVTVAFVPNFLLGHGRTLLAGPLSPVITELKTLAVVDDRSRELAKAMLVGLHAGEDYFHVECRVEAGNALPPSLVAHTLHERLVAIPLRVRSQFEVHRAAVALSPARAVLARYPLMLSALAGYLRAGAVERQVVLTAALPREAAHNLTLGTAWALALDLSTAPTEVKALTFAQRLEQRGAFKVPSDSLDRIVVQLREHLGLEIDIVGGDLEVLGITKSKRVTIDLKDASAAEVLTELARVGNPANTQHVGRADQHLVWVIDDSRGPGKERILYTSRARAAQRGKLPPEFTIMSGER